MGLFDRFRRPSSSVAKPRAQSSSEGMAAMSLDSPEMLEFIRNGLDGSRRNLKNMAVLRCVSLICESIGRLPVSLIVNGDDKEFATGHPAHRLLKFKPNSWQTPYEFKTQMQLAVLRHGNGYARVIWSAGRPIALIPLDSLAVDPHLTSDWTMEYRYTRPDGGLVTLGPKDMLHLRDLSVDGEKGLSRMKLAKDAIDLALDAQNAAARQFKTGVLAGGSIEFPQPMSDPAYERMKESLRDDYSGAENSGKWMILEEGAKANRFATTAQEAQHIENRNAQIEEIARAFGVPRPLLMMNDTSWGSGIEQLSILFVQYGLAHWFTCWEEAGARSLLADAELETYQFKFNERALLRGTLKDQAEFFAKALGSGGSAPWMTQNEVRGLSDLPRGKEPQADSLQNQMSKPQKGNSNDPAQAA